MDEFAGILAQSFGFRSQGKSAPMAASKRTTTCATATDNGRGGNFVLGSSRATESVQVSNSMDRPFFSNDLFGSASNSETLNSGNLDDHGGVFGGTSKYSRPFPGGGRSSLNYASFSSNSSNLPGYGDDDDIFGGVLGMNNPRNAKSDNVYSLMDEPLQRTNQFDDFLGNVGKIESDLNRGKTSTREMKNNAAGFDHFIAEFGSSLQNHGFVKISLVPLM